MDAIDQCLMREDGGRVRDIDVDAEESRRILPPLLPLDMVLLLPLPLMGLGGTGGRGRLRPGYKKEHKQAQQNDERLRPGYKKDRKTQQKDEWLWPDYQKERKTQQKDE